MSRGGTATQDAVSAIMADHRRMERVFEKLRRGEGDRRSLLDECAARLTAHSHAEEQRVYPTLAKADPAERGDVEHGTDEHHEAEQMLEGLLAMRPDAKEFDAALAEFIETVRHHVEEEETKILPALREAVDAETLNELGAIFEEIRLRELAGTEYADEGTGGPETSGEASRADLYERARDADISGRSKMNKDELAQALQQQEDR